MDIMYFIFMIVLIGIFFFLDKFQKSQNSMFVVILLTFIGFITLQFVSIDIVEYGKYTMLDNVSMTYEYNTIDITNAGMGLFNVQSFLVLVFGFFLMVAVTNLFLGKKYEGKNYED